MRRFLSIAICSVGLCSFAYGQAWTWTGTSGAATLNKSGAVGYFVNAYFNVYFNGAVISTNVLLQFPATTYMRSIGFGSGNGHYYIQSLTTNITHPIPSYSGVRTNATNGSLVFMPDAVPGPMPPADPIATNSFTWTFAPQWAGTILSIRSTNGTTLGTWGLPSVMTSNYVLSSSIVTNASLLNGAQVFLDGVSAASLAMASTNSNLEGFADRPGYEFEFDSSFAGGFWQIRRQDGSVAASGSAATLGSVVSGRVTVLPEGSQGTVWTQVAPGDGLPAEWVNSGITVQGNNVTRQYFAATGTPAPQATPTLPQPTPAPGASPAPTPGSSTGGSSVTPTTDPSTNVSVTVTNAVLPSMDAGEQGVLDKIDSMNDKFAQGLEDFGLAYENIGLTFNEFRKLVLTPPGKTCVLEFGPVSINLSAMIPGWVREATKIVFLFAGVAAMWRFITWTFSS